jgi:hypothetical protein
MPQNGPKAADDEEQLDARLVDLLHQMRDLHLELHEPAQTATS